MRTASVAHTNLTRGTPEWPYALVIIVQDRAHRPACPISRWIAARIVTVILIYHRHTPVDRINRLRS
jgi:hypothetical protein